MKLDIQVNWKMTSDDCATGYILDCPIELKKVGNRYNIKILNGFLDDRKCVIFKGKQLTKNQTINAINIVAEKRREEFNTIDNVSCVPATQMTMELKQQDVTVQELALWTCQMQKLEYVSDTYGAQKDIRFMEVGNFGRFNTWYE